MEWDPAQKTSAEHHEQKGSLVIELCRSDPEHPRERVPNRRKMLIISIPSTRPVWDWQSVIPIRARGGARGVWLDRQSELTVP